MLYRLRSALYREMLGFAERRERLARPLNRHFINRILGVTRTRPHPLSTLHDYPSWPGLVDRGYSARHLPPAGPRVPQPDASALLQLFRRKGAASALCDKSTCLFPAFAQYLTDGFIRTETNAAISDRLRRTTSNHDIDLCPLYGRTPEQTEALRLKSNVSGLRGRLRSQRIHGEEYAPFLYRGGSINPRYRVLDTPLGLRHPGGPDDPRRPDPRRRDVLFAFGGDRANANPQVAMLNTLLLREHNRLAREIETAHPDWGDERIFQTTRNSLIVMFIKIVVEEYVNHISPTPFRLRMDPGVAWQATWNRPNRTTCEFSLLYRWHALIPDVFRWNGADVPLAGILMDNRHLLQGGLAAFARDLSAQPATALSPFNTPERLLQIVAAAITQGRVCALAPYADYREHVGLPRPERFSDVTGNVEAAARLSALYDSPADIEFFVGIFMEDRVQDSPLPALVLRLAGVDAFSQALTNPLLSEHVFRPETFSAPGWAAIRETRSVADLVRRNTPGGTGEGIFMTRPDWRPGGRRQTLREARA